MEPGSNGPIGPRDRRSVVSIRIACLLAAVVATAAGCASPLYRTHPDLPARTNAIRAAGLLPPAIAMYEEQFRFKLVPHGEWAPAAATAVRDALVAEMTAAGFPVAPIDAGDPELVEMAELFGAVDFSIERHAYDDGWKETFPGKARALDYALGPAAETMERHRVDAVWFVAGFNLLPTTGTRIADAVDVLLSIVSAAGGGPGVSTNLVKLELRAALVDKSGTVLFHCVLRQPDVGRARQGEGRADSANAESGVGPPAGDGSLPDDIRDPRVARLWAKAVLSEYRKAAAR